LEEYKSKKKPAMFSWVIISSQGSSPGLRGVDIILVRSSPFSKMDSIASIQNNACTTCAVMPQKAGLLDFIRVFITMQYPSAVDLSPTLKFTGIFCYDVNEKDAR
jgi:hypothetical protein